MENEKHILYNQIAKNIKKYRNEAKMTQAVLAEKIDVSHEYIRMIESNKGDKTFSVYTIYNISKVLNVDISKLFEFDNN